MKRRVTVEVVERFHFDIEGQVEGEEMTDERLSERIEELAYDGELTWLRQEGMGKRLYDEDHHGLNVEVHGYCEVHPDAVIDGIWHDQEGAACCYKCWSLTPHGVATMERINEAKASAVLKKRIEGQS